jgi:site-specific DNA-methyltransferase (adenine-specific)
MQLYNGDCLEVMKSIPNKSIDLILCDLPYGITKCKWDTPIDLFAMWNQYNRIIKDNAPILLFAQTPFDKVLGSSNLSMLKYEWIWEKTQATGHLNAKNLTNKLVIYILLKNPSLCLSILLKLIRTKKC